MIDQAPASPVPTPKKTLFFSGDEYFESLLKSISEAKTDICFESYIFEVDTIGLRICDALIQASERGVQIFLMVDGFGSIRTISRLRVKFLGTPIKFKTYHPFLLGILHPLRWFSFFKSLDRLNIRNHRKTILIDDKKIYTGSINISDVHSEKISKDQAWRDTGICLFALDPKQVQPLRISFFQAWRATKSIHPILKKDRKNENQYFARLNDTIFLRWHHTRDLQHRIGKAKKRILVTNAYFLPRKKLIKKLTQAARDGVDVCLCLPAVSDVWLSAEVGRVLYRSLIRAGVKIFEFQNKILHAKTIVIDDWAMVGSHNFNHRSFLHDLEIDVAFQDSEFVQQLVAQWNKDLENSVKLNLENLQADSHLRKWSAQIIYFFRYWL